MRKASLIKLLVPVVALGLVSTLTVACGGGSPTLEPLTTPSAGLTPPAAASPQPASGKVQLRVAAIKLDGASRKVSLLEKSPQMTPQDFYSLYVRPETDAYIYIFQYDCGDNETTVLFPNPKFSNLTNPIKAGAAVWLPREDVRFWFKLDTDVPNNEKYEGCNSKQEEKIIVMASKEKDQEAEVTRLNILSPPPTPTPVPAKPTPEPVPLNILLRAPDVEFVGETDLKNATVDLPDDVKATLLQGSTAGGRLIYRLELNR